jgi:hypothetical protein
MRFSLVSVYGFFSLIVKLFKLWDFAKLLILLKSLFASHSLIIVIDAIKDEQVYHTKNHFSSVLFFEGEAGF